uniref:Probable potassium transport system protein Kup n=1 Tax=Acidobacterium capsulatum TaxID=33075 RepID=A0A7V4XSD6_9BACT
MAEQQVEVKGRDAYQKSFPEGSSQSRDRMSAALALAVLGVVYGDIGTSPIYALQQCFIGDHPLPVSQGNVLGLLSLVFWTLVMVISIKYMVYVLCNDNKGEGGIFALLALLRPNKGQSRWPRRMLILIGVVGAATLYGDSMITPAISVLSAVEGLHVATPSLSAFVDPITVLILLLLFTVQKFGSGKIGIAFGPVMVVWFLSLAVLGIHGILHAPVVLLALLPTYAVSFFLHNGVTGFLVLSAVFLVTTGGEALYADLGHFGRTPIRRVWFGFVLPALLLDYFGQGALLLAHPQAVKNPFFLLAPHWALVPLVLLATAATVIASQAAITGAFSLTRQAIQLNYLPQFQVLQTSAESSGQIYVPLVNWLLMLAAIGLVLAFHSSTNLASAYGVAVNMSMAITTLLVFHVHLERNGWKLRSALLFLIVFLAIDLSFLGSNMLKIPDGGWISLAIGAAMFVVMTSWRQGSRLLAEQMAENAEPFDQFVQRIRKQKVPRLPGTAVFLTGRLHQTPPALQQVVRHVGVLQEQVILLTVLIEKVPRVNLEDRLELDVLEDGFVRVVLHYGYMQGPNIPSDLQRLKEHGVQLDMGNISYFIGQVDMLAGRKRSGMMVFRDRLFVWMARNTRDMTSSYHIPADQVMTVGLQVGI